MKIMITNGISTYKRIDILQHIYAGAEVVRYNLGVGIIPLPTIKNNIVSMRRMAEEAQRQVEVMADLPGGKVRLGSFPEDVVKVRAGDVFNFRSGSSSPSAKEYVAVQHPNFVDELNVGQHFSLADGHQRFEVAAKECEALVCKAISSHQVEQLKGINFGVVRPWSEVKADVFQLINDIRDVQPEYLAISFARSATQVEEIKEFVANSSAWRPKLIAKIECPEGLKNVSSIAESADLIMVARGDLALQLSYELVGVHQRSIIKHSKEKQTPVIVATQVFDSLLHGTLPSRAEISDITQMYIDGVFGVLLAKESSTNPNSLLSTKNLKNVITKLRNECFDS